MKTSLPPEATRELTERLHAANQAFAQDYPGATSDRQPVHTVYGGAHLFKADTAQKLGAIARQALDQFAPDFIDLARALGLPGADDLPSTDKAKADLKMNLAAEPAAMQRLNRPAWLAQLVYNRVVEKLPLEPVEDYRIDFEDGYGHRPDEEEDGHAARAAVEVARGLAAGTLPPFIGIRLKPLTAELQQRSQRTLDIFLTTLLTEKPGRLPANFVVTLPKVTIPEQVATIVGLFELLEKQLGLTPGSLKLELMIETPQAILNGQGQSALPHFWRAAQGRCVGAHFGAYDYTSACNITAAAQTLQHPACDFARQMMQAAFAGTGVWLSDGATNLLPVPPHRASATAPLTEEQQEENQHAVHQAWQRHYENIQHALKSGFYQGWDLHPAQLPVRYAAVYAFFLAGLEQAAARLKNFVDRAAQATRVSGIFDDAATGQGLLNYFLRGINCGALTQEETLRLTGLTLAELRSRSFLKILAARRGAK